MNSSLRFTYCLMLANWNKPVRNDLKASKPLEM
jgi:hypothetical protein